MKLSKAGVDLIKGFEGFSSTPYQDSVGVWTIGYGHIEGIGPNSRPISEPQASALLASDINNVYGAAVNRLNLPLNQNQFDAVCSFVYNLGVGTLETSFTFGRLLRGHQWKAAADSMLLYDHAGGQVLEGLRRRRIEERALFLKPAPTPEPLSALNPDERKWVDEFDRLIPHKIFHLVTLHKLRVDMGVRCTQIKVRAAKDGWDKYNRRERYKIMLDRLENRKP